MDDDDDDDENDDDDDDTYILKTNIPELIVHFNGQ